MAKTSKNAADKESVVEATPEVVQDTPVMDSIQEAQEQAVETPIELAQIPGAIDAIKPKTGFTPEQSAVTFTPEQMEIIQQIVKQSSARGSGQPISVYGQRDPRKIQTVKVSNFDGKFVVGFKDLNTNPYKKEPKYSVMKQDLIRGFTKPEPFVTLLLSSNGTDIEELTLPLVDFMDQRMKIEVPVIHMEEKEVIEDHGLLGQRNDEMAIGLDDSGKPLQRIAIKQESKKVIQKFYVQIPGFAHPVEFIGSDFLA